MYKIKKNGNNLSYHHSLKICDHIKVTVTITDKTSSGEPRLILDTRIRGVDDDECHIELDEQSTSWLRDVFGNTEFTDKRVLFHDDQIMVTDKMTSYLRLRISHMEYGRMGICLIPNHLRNEFTDVLKQGLILLDDMIGCLESQPIVDNL
jgi:hypothetical protein